MSLVRARSSRSDGFGATGDTWAMANAENSVSMRGDHLRVLSSAIDANASKVEIPLRSDSTDAVSASDSAAASALGHSSPVRDLAERHAESGEV
jgi:hypothetical protein